MRSQFSHPSLICTQAHPPLFALLFIYFLGSWKLDLPPSFHLCCLRAFPLASPPLIYHEPSAILLLNLPVRGPYPPTREGPRTALSGGFKMQLFPPRACIMGDYTLENLGMK